VLTDTRRMRQQCTSFSLIEAGELAATRIARPALPLYELDVYPRCHSETKPSSNFFNEMGAGASSALAPGA